MEYHSVVHQPLTFTAAPSYQSEYAATAAAYQPASMLPNIASRFSARPSQASQPSFVNSAFSQQVMQPRPYPTQFQDVLPYTSQPPREAPVPAFYNYRPNEVKHRKRTTRAQTKILEEQFKSTDKPDAATRSDLSHRLGMTPREVQVWFQNRRAKEKKLRAQAQAALNKENEQQLHSATSENETSSRDLSPAAVAQEATDVAGVIMTQSPVEQFAAEPASISNAQAADYSPSRSFDDVDCISPSTVHPSQHSDRANSLELFSVQPAVAQQVPAIPTLPRVVSVPAIPTLNMVSATQSTSAPSTSNGMSFAGLADPLAHRGSLPHIRPAPYYAEQHHQRSTSSPVFTPSSSDSEIPPASAVYTQSRFNPAAVYQQAPSYVFPPRVSQAPVSGPLPTPDYSFGAPVYGVAGVEAENDDDGTAQYAQYSRFGSFASVAGSDTTSRSGASLLTSEANNSAFEDDASPFAFHPDQKRPSFSLPVSAPASDLYPSPALQDISPWSSGTFSSASPMSATSYGRPVSQPAPESALFVDYGFDGQHTDPQVVVSQASYTTPTKTEAGVNVAFQNAMYGYNDNSSAEIVGSYDVYGNAQMFGSPASIGQQASPAQFDAQGFSYAHDTMTMQQPYEYGFTADMYNNQYGA